MKLLNFSQKEYKSRLKRVKDRMLSEGLEALVITEPSNIYYLTGYDAWSFYTSQAVVVVINEEMPHWIGRIIDRQSARVTTYLPDENIIAYPDIYVHTPDRHPSQFMADYILRLQPNLKSVGVEMGAYYYTARDHAELVKSMPNVTFKDAELLVNWVRFIKSEQEVSYMREAGVISDRMFKSALEIAEPGVRECDVAAALYKSAMEGGETFGGVPASSPPHLAFGVRALEPHPTFSEQPIAPNSVANLEFSGARLRYHAPISRTIYFGQPPQAYLDLASWVVEGLEESLNVVKPGITAADVEVPWRKVLGRHGIEKNGRLGYSIGIAYAPTWGERTSSLRPGDFSLLEPGVAFHLMAGLWLQDTGITITQSFVVSETGYEALTKTPRQLFVK